MFNSGIAKNKLTISCLTMILVDSPGFGIENSLILHSRGGHSRHNVGAHTLNILIHQIHIQNLGEIIKLSP